MIKYINQGHLLRKNKVIKITNIIDLKSIINLTLEIFLKQI
jgi:hypothetical protein